MTIAVEFKDQIFHLIGEINFANVDDLYHRVLHLLHEHKDLSCLQINFKQVTHSDSSGLALVLVLLGYAKQHQLAFKIDSLLPNLVAIAKASRLESFISAA